jgi:hypothetical protein
MRSWCLKEGDFLYAPGKRLVMASKSKRKRARRLPCRKRPSLCRHCAFVTGIISIDLLEHLVDPDFTLPAPLTREQAKLWVPPTLIVNTGPPESLNVSPSPARQS